MYILNKEDRKIKYWISGSLSLLSFYSGALDSHNLEFYLCGFIFFGYFSYQFNLKEIFAETFSNIKNTINIMKSVSSMERVMFIGIMFRALFPLYATTITAMFHLTFENAMLVFIEYQNLDSMMNKDMYLYEYTIWRLFKSKKEK